MKNVIKYMLFSGLIALSATAGNASAAIINFSFTGRLTLFSANPSGDITTFPIISGTDTTFGPNGYQTPIAANLTIDTANGTGFSDLAFNLNFQGQPVAIHNVTLNFLANNMIGGQMLGDWNGTLNNPFNILWDGSGLFNAINAGLQVGDRISGTNLFRDFNGDGTANTFIQTVGSATPWSDSWIDPNGNSLNQGPAPIATAPGAFGISSGPFAGIQVQLDIGSGNSLHVTSIQSVPIPAALWLFGSGFVGLLGVARRRKQLP